MQYWLVGAKWGDKDKAPSFVENGYWALGYKSTQKPNLFKKAKQIQIGDKIAIKRQNGKGASDITILHIGIVKGVVHETDRAICIVDWVATDLNRSVKGRGCYKSIHGPYEKNEWIAQIFCI